MLNKDIVAASSTPIVLSILARGESYGYDIIQQIRKLSDDQIIWSDGMLYPLLHRLENKELISSEWRKSESGRKRKYYQINDKGSTVLQREKLQWKIVNETLIKLWGTSYA